MQKLIFSLFILFLAVLPAFAQKGNNQFIPALEIGLPTGDFNDFKTGIGVSAKALFGVGDHGQIGISTGYTGFKLKGSNDDYKLKISIIPILVGYRYRFTVVYLEPQIGYGIYTTTIKTETGGTDSKSSSSDGGFTWTLGGGVQLGSVDLGVRYQAGYPGGGSIGIIGFHAGYVFRSGKN